MENKHNTDLMCKKDTLEKNEKNEKERLNLNLPKDILDFLRESSEKSHQTITGSLIQILIFHKNIIEMSKKGCKIAIEDENGKINYFAPLFF